MSSTLPCWSTARHRYRCAPLIWTNTSSRCHLSPGRGPRRRSWFAYCCPNRSHQARIVSYDTSTPRSSISSCTSRKLNGNRWYSQTQWLMISGGNRKPYTTSLQRSRSSILPHLTFPAHQPDSALQALPCAAVERRIPRCVVRRVDDIRDLRRDPAQHHLEPLAQGHL